MESCRKIKRRSKKIVRVNAKIANNSDDKNRSRYEGERENTKSWREKERGEQNIFRGKTKRCTHKSC